MLLVIYQIKLKTNIIKPLEEVASIEEPAIQPAIEESVIQGTSKNPEPVIQGTSKIPELSINTVLDSKLIQKPITEETIIVDNPDEPDTLEQQNLSLMTNIEKPEKEEKESEIKEINS